MNVRVSAEQLDMALLKRPLPRELEEESTDVGSSASDNESTCSRDASSRLPRRRLDCQVLLAPPPGLTKIVDQVDVAADHAVHRTLPSAGARHPPVGRFGGTPLDTIPGTPTAPRLVEGDAAPVLGYGPSGSPKRRMRRLATTSQALDPVLAYGPAGSPKRRVRSIPAATTSHGATPRLATRPTGSETSTSGSEAEPVFGYGPAGSPKRRMRPVPTAMCQESDATSVLAYGPRGSPKRRVRFADERLASPKKRGSANSAALAYAPPVSPKKRAARAARAAVLERARREAIPLKVRLLDGLTPFQSKSLDPTLPAKKRPPFPESCGDTATGEPNTPVQKKPSRFLLEEPLLFSVGVREPR